MKPDNPACYECPADKRGIHTWRKYEDTGRAMCRKCLLVLTPAQTADVFREDSRALPPE